MVRCFAMSFEFRRVTFPFRSFCDFCYGGGEQDEELVLLHSDCDFEDVCERSTSIK